MRTDESQRPYAVRNAIYRRIAEKVVEHDHLYWGPQHLCDGTFREGCHRPHVNQFTRSRNGTSHRGVE